MKNPKIVVMPPDCSLPKTLGKKETIWLQYRLCFAVAEYQILGDQHFIIL